MAEKADSGKRITKDAANYRTNVARKHCEDCSMFRAPNACTLVEGHISRLGTCRFWERKRG